MSRYRTFLQLSLRFICETSPLNPREPLSVSAFLAPHRRRLKSPLPARGGCATLNDSPFQIRWLTERFLPEGNLCNTASFQDCPSVRKPPPVMFWRDGFGKSSFWGWPLDRGL